MGKKLIGLWKVTEDNMDQIADEVLAALAGLPGKDGEAGDEEE